MTKEDKQMHFEEAFKRLEQIVGNLESGDLSLEESMKLFEEGIGLTEACKSRLEDAEQKIQLLLKNSDGKLSLEDKD
ncbi:MAG: exodeoxyribonuclease VII small subunit [Candidatus Neomarinimicrobiota bacterium]|jgi:exodeoxyribonuclease VII small subunit|nr:exodeoxyribonuclease VII small subunit [Candidatus Neomarinimicrobiota bacterium]MEC9026895.1 exodeoxyribonuclease VII small subunit [Candidatus Neomarinimicrobiota bacterium]MED5266839.1 exodeoxyribonuclease VII small subunit [Candidatus Neomarinimicrobiota bacterium]|tara:strand:+ start:227 stop:457 length:231 start_codon:yes stop_codon:yes gene_type:complete